VICCGNLCVTKSVPGSRFSGDLGGGTAGQCDEIGEAQRWGSEELSKLEIKLLNNTRKQKAKKVVLKMLYFIASGLKSFHVRAVIWVERYTGVQNQV
jgi:hypothetical protein